MKNTWQHRIDRWNVIKRNHQLTMHLQTAYILQMTRNVSISLHPWSIVSKRSLIRSMQLWVSILIDKTYFEESNFEKYILWRTMWSWKFWKKIFFSQNSIFPLHLLNGFLTYYKFFLVSQHLLNSFLYNFCFYFISRILEGATTTKKPNRNIGLIIIKSECGNSGRQHNNEKSRDNRRRNPNNS